LVAEAQVVTGNFGHHEKVSFHRHINIT